MNPQCKAKLQITSTINPQRKFFTRRFSGFNARNIVINRQQRGEREELNGGVDEIFKLGVN